MSVTNISAEAVTTADAADLIAAYATLRRIIDAANDAAWKAPTSVSDGPVRAQDFGKLAAFADVARGAIFDVLNVGSAYCEIPACRLGLDGITAVNRG